MTCATARRPSPLAAGVEMKVVQHLLGTPPITTTSVLYANVLPELARSAAEATARVVPRTKINIFGHATARMDNQNDQTSAETQTPGQHGC
jgi:hypothetical protein